MSGPGPPHVDATALLPLQPATGKASPRESKGGSNVPKGSSKRGGSKDLVVSPPPESIKAAKKEGSFGSAAVDSGKKAKKNKHARAPVDAEDDEDASAQRKLKHFERARGGRAVSRGKQTCSLQDWLPASPES